MPSSPAKPVLTLGESMLIAVGGKGPLETISEARISTAGAEGNVAIGLARLGAPVTWVGRVGDDAPGRRVVRDLRGEGVTVRATVESSAQTALILKERRSAGRSGVLYFRTGSAGSRLSEEDLNEIEFSAFAILHVTGITMALSVSAREAVKRAVGRANEAGVPVSFDVNHRSSLWSNDDYLEHYRWVVERSTIVFAGEDEALLVEPKASDPFESVTMIAQRGPSEIVIKQGEKGCFALHQGQLTSCPPVPVPVVDTVGAGDAFVAGYLADRLEGVPMLGRLETAVACGALACTVAGDWEGAARRSDIAALRSVDPVER
jgi:2-dehydro-3-deoxygluconokinase